MKPPSAHHNGAAGAFRLVGFRTAGPGGLCSDPIKDFKRIAEDTIMRTLHVLGLVAIVLVGFGAKLIVSAPTAAAGSGAFQSVSLDVPRMHENKRLPEQPLRDMSFVYAD